VKNKRFWGLSQIILLILLLVITTLPAGGKSAPTTEKTYKIGITQIATHPSLDAARTGFIDQMAEEGFIEGENVEYDYRNAERDMTLAATIAQKFISGPVDLIFSITTPSTQACVAADKNKEIPIVFGLVTDPVAAGLVESWERPGGYVTGISDWTEMAPHLELILEVCPYVKRLGTIYNPGEINSLVQIAELKKAAPDFGITEIVEASAAGATEVIPATESLMGRADAIWIPTDNTIGTALEAVIKVCEQHKVALFIANPSHVERGVIGAVGINPYSLGKEDAKIAARILRGEKPADIPVKKCPVTDLYLNPSAAERMGVTIPQSALDKATKIVGE